MNLVTHMKKMIGSQHSKVPEKTTNSCGLTVMFDGACPLCRREVGVYRNLVPLEPIHWLDVSDVQNSMASGETRAQYLARFHVRTANGTLLSGAAAFVALWSSLPGWRWLGRFGALPGVTPVLECMYRGFLHLRPWMQRAARRLDASAAPMEKSCKLPADQVAKPDKTGAGLPPEC